MTAQAAEAPQGEATYRAILKREAAQAGLPFDIADAVMAIESGYDPTRIGGVGEIGLMQVRPGTAAMLGFTGNTSELARPETNIHFGVAYLAGAWRLSNGNLCQALMKYRAGHGETAMSPLSVDYCTRARAHLASVGSSLAGAPLPLASAGTATREARLPPMPSKHLKGAAYWKVFEARIKVINARIEKRWRMMASK